MEHSDEDLYFRYHRSGDLQAFNQLYERYKGALYRFILRMIGNSATAEEVFQEVWASLIKSNQYRQGPGSFKTFVYTIARNKAIDHYRRNRIQLVSDAYVQEEQIEESEWDGADQAQAITKAVEALPAEQKEVFLLKVEAEMSLEEIAQMGGESREAIKSRYRYAVAKIRKWVSEENNDG